MKKIVSVVVCTILLCSLFCLVSVVSYAESSTATLTVGDVSGNPGDTVFVPVNIQSNPGFSNIAFSVNFDKSTLSYKGTIEGALPDYSIFDHSKDGRIAVAYTGDYNVEGDGALVCFQFQINKKAKLKTGKISLSKTYITNSDSKKVSHSTDNGSLKVAKACSGEHEYSDWQVLFAPTCTKGGAKAKYCIRCGHCESEALAASGHRIEGKFKVDVIAENDQPGMLSRHCTVCGAKTSIVTYTVNNPAALSLNEIMTSLSESGITNLVYFLNGGVTYPEICYDVTDVSDFIRRNSNQNDEIDKPAKNEDKTVNVDVAVDRVLKTLFGNKNRLGIVNTVKRAAIAGEIPIKLLCKLICLILI